MAIELLVFHDRPDQSRANATLADAAQRIRGVEVTHVGVLYDSPARLDVERETRRLLGAEGLILQFPVQWYATPVLLKAWQDSVLTRMFYIHDDEGAQLAGLPVLVCATAGNDEEAYTERGSAGFPLNDLLPPLRATARRCGWSWTTPFTVYRANKMDDDELAGAASRYAAHVEAWSSQVLGSSGRRTVHTA